MLLGLHSVAVQVRAPYELECPGLSPGPVEQNIHPGEVKGIHRGAAAEAGTFVLGEGNDGSAGRGVTAPGD